MQLFRSRRDRKISVTYRDSRGVEEKRRVGEKRGWERERGREDKLFISWKVDDDAGGKVALERRSPTHAQDNCGTKMPPCPSSTLGIYPYPAGFHTTSQGLVSVFKCVRAFASACVIKGRRQKILRGERKEYRGGMRGRQKSKRRRSEVSCTRRSRRDAHQTTPTRRSSSWDFFHYYILPYYYFHSIIILIISIYLFIALCIIFRFDKCRLMIFKAGTMNQ